MKEKQEVKFDYELFIAVIGGFLSTAVGIALVFSIPVALIFSGTVAMGYGVGARLMQELFHYRLTKTEIQYFGRRKEKS